MKVAIFEIGNYHDSPDIVRVFSSVEKAIENIPSGFEKRKNFSLEYLYYEDEINKKWLNIKEYEVE